MSESPLFGKRRVVHIITGLRQGGAEGALYRLLSASPLKEHSAVVSLLDDGVYARRIRALHVPVYSLGMTHFPSTLLSFIHLVRLLRAMRPEVVQTWMYHADLIGGLAARLAGVGRVFWGVRNSDLETMQGRRSTRAIVSLCAWFSGRLPTGAVSCSRRAIGLHIEAGYKVPITYIPNGYDLNKLKASPEARTRLRAEWGIGSDAPVFGSIGRFDPKKDQLSFLRAAGRVAESVPEARFLMCGAHISSENIELQTLAREVGIADRLLLLGPRDDIAEIMSSLDFLVLSSAYGEAFPNVVAEAMACGTPCVVTDVGDAAEIVCDTGWVVPPRNAELLSAAMLRAMDEKPADREQRGARARQSIVDRYDIAAMVKRYESLWEIRQP